jgi:hypothetical protein
MAGEPRILKVMGTTEVVHNIADHIEPKIYFYILHGSVMHI